MGRMRQADEGTLSLRGDEQPQVGDWYCPNCKDLQFKRNLMCRRCGAPHPGHGNTIGGGVQNTHNNSHQYGGMSHNYNNQNSGMFNNQNSGMSNNFNNQNNGMSNNFNNQSFNNQSGGMSGQQGPQDMQQMMQRLGGMMQNSNPETA